MGQQSGRNPIEVAINGIGTRNRAREGDGSMTQPGHDRLKLMCPRRLEPFMVDRIALAAWREARDYFGKPVDVDIYVTFIGTTQVKIGQLRASANEPQIAQISYDFTELDLL